MVLVASMLRAEHVVPIPPLAIPESASQGAAPGDWKAASPAVALDYAETEKAAREAEAAGKVAEALTLWERVLDRTTTTEENRSNVRERIKELRPKVAINTDPDKAKKWNVLVVIAKEVKVERTNREGKVEKIHQIFTPQDFEQLGKSLAGFRDMVFEWSSGVVLLDFEVLVLEEPVAFTLAAGERRDFALLIRDVVPLFKKVRERKEIHTVIGCVKYRGSEGPSLSRLWTAAIYGRVNELDSAGYMMVPWGPDYPYKGETTGEMELHEWLHQIDDSVHANLGYPRGTTRSSDDGRTENDSRTDGEQEYKRPQDVTTWVYFYKHIMAEHMTRQIWDELTINRRLEVKPGEIIKIEQ